MKPELLRKLTLNALSQLRDHQSRQGCDDLCEDSQLIQGITKEELAELGKDYGAICAQDGYYNGAISREWQLVDLIAASI